MQDLVRESCKKCYQDEVSKVVAGDILNTQDLDDCGTINQKFNSSLSAAIERLTKLKLQIGKLDFTADCTESQYSTS